MPDDRIVSLQALRFLAASLVTIYHTIVVATGNRHPPVFGSIGPAGVDLFFVLSGFIIATVMRRDRRLLRFPVQSVEFLEILPTLPFPDSVLDGLFGALGDVAPRAALHFADPHPDWPESIPHRRLDPAIRDAVLRRRGDRVGPAKDRGASFAGRMPGDFRRAPSSPGTPCSAISSWRPPDLRVLAFGVALAWKPRSNVAAVIGLLAGVVGTGLLIAIKYDPEHDWRRPLICGLTAAGIVYAALHVRLEGRLWRAVAFLGDASYALYLCHLIILFLAVKALAILPLWLTAPLMLTVCWWVAVLLHEVIEKPANRLHFSGPPLGWSPRSSNVSEPVALSWALQTA